MMKKLSLTLCSLLALGCLVSSIPSGAQPNLSKQLMQALEINLIPTFALRRLIDWKVGDEANFVVMIGDLEAVRIKEFVHSEVGDSIWIHMQITGLVNREVRTKINRDTAKIEEYLEDGQVATPYVDPLEIIVQADGGKITVPAGEFHTVYIKAKSKKGDSAERKFEFWLNQRDTTMRGLVRRKTTVKSNGEITIITTSLLNFTKK